MPQQISPRALAERLAGGQPVHLVDVRSPEEHDFARLPDSQLIPLPELMGRCGEVEPAEGVPVVVYCHHGVRSMTGAALLERAGLTGVLSLAGGIDAWSLHVDPTVPRY
jgi:rhodanese-related sulfurtransferase